jgi:hypothetical protein
MLNDANYVFNCVYIYIHTYIYIYTHYNHVFFLNIIIYIYIIYNSNYDNMKKSDQARDMDLLQFHAPRWPP